MIWAKESKRTLINIKVESHEMSTKSEISNAHLDPRIFQKKFEICVISRKIQYDSPTKIDDKGF